MTPNDHTASFWQAKFYCLSNAKTDFSSTCTKFYCRLESVSPRPRRSRILSPRRLLGGAVSTFPTMHVPNSTSKTKQNIDVPTAKSSCRKISRGSEQIRAGAMYSAAKMQASYSSDAQLIPTTIIARCIASQPQVKYRSV